MNTHKYEIGDKAIIIGVPEEWEPGDICYVGALVIITSELNVMYNGKSNREALVHVVDMQSNDPGSVIAVEPYNLKPYDDSNGLGNWDSCIFKPADKVIQDEIRKVVDSEKD